MKRLFTVLLLIVSFALTAQNKSVVKKLQITKLKNAELLKTDAKGNVVKGTLPQNDNIYTKDGTIPSGRVINYQPSDNTKITDFKEEFVKDATNNFEGKRTKITRNDGITFLRTQGVGNKWNADVLEDNVQILDADNELKAGMEFKDGIYKVFQTNKLGKGNHSEIILTPKSINKWTRTFISPNLTVSSNIALNKKGIILQSRIRDTTSNNEEGKVVFRLKPSILSDSTRSAASLVAEQVWIKSKGFVEDRRDNMIIKWSETAPPGTYPRKVYNEASSSSDLTAYRETLEQTDADNSTQSTFVQSKTMIHLVVGKVTNGVNTTSSIFIGNGGVNINSFMRLQPRNTPPAQPDSGTVYFDSTDNKLKCYDGTTWHNLF